MDSKLLMSRNIGKVSRRRVGSMSPNGRHSRAVDKYRTEIESNFYPMEVLKHDNVNVPKLFY